MLLGQMGTVCGHLFCAKQFRAQGRLVFEGARRGPPQPLDCSKPLPFHIFLAQREAWITLQRCMSRKRCRRDE